MKVRSAFRAYHPLADRSPCWGISLWSLTLLTFLNCGAMADILPGSYPMDASLSATPVRGMLGFDGGAFVTPASEPQANLIVDLDSGAYVGTIPDVIFTILGGFGELSTYVIDANGNQQVDTGDDVVTSLGPGQFQLADAGGVVVSGQFQSATFSSKVGGTTGTLSSSPAGGLDLSPGPSFQFPDGTQVTAIVSPEGLEVGVSRIPGGGLNVSGVVPVLPPVFSANLDPFGWSNGALDAQGVADVVPEPSTLSLGLAALGVLGLALVARRKKP